MRTAQKKPHGKTNTRRRSLRLATLERVVGVTVDDATAMYAQLTARQREVAGMITRGMTNREIATQLGISVKTLDIHRADVYEKLRSRTAAGIARIVFLAELADAAEPLH